jgi:hypothetical protein
MGTWREPPWDRMEESATYERNAIRPNQIQISWPIKFFIQFQFERVFFGRIARETAAKRIHTPIVINEILKNITRTGLPDGVHIFIPKIPLWVSFERPWNRKCFIL